MYYLLLKSDYEAIKTQVSHKPTWTLDGTKCIVHNDNGLAITEYEDSWATAAEVNEWRWDADTTEWQNWMTQEEHDTMV